MNPLDSRSFHISALTPNSLRGSRAAARPGPAGREWNTWDHPYTEGFGALDLDAESADEPQRVASDR
jgi:hypothetical protein